MLAVPLAPCRHSWRAETVPVPVAPDVVRWDVAVRCVLCPAVRESGVVHSARRVTDDAGRAGHRRPA